MSTNVIKYGGSNLRHPNGINQLIRIVREYSDPVIVVSALYGVTDSIDQFIENKNITKEGINNFIVRLNKKHIAFINPLVPATSKKIDIIKALQDRIFELEHILLGIFYLRELPDHLKNYILSYGERLAAILITGILRSHNLLCRELLPENIGLIATGNPANASIDLEASSRRVKQSLTHPGIKIVPGFYGISPDNRVSLLGRGGTDYSAACIAHCLDASTLDIWKDVDGFQSSDPKLVNEAVCLDNLTYDEAAELAYFGARILHPRTVEPLAEKNIPIRLFSTKQERLRPVTIINGKKHIREDIIKSITFSDDYAVLRLTGPGVGIKPGILAKVTSTLNEEGINISSVITSQIAINLIINKTDGDLARVLVSGLDQPVIKSIGLLKEVTLLALVGHGMVDHHGVAARTFSVLANKRINVHLSSMGASEVTTYLLINRTDKQTALNGIHREFFGNSNVHTIKKAG